MTKNALAIRCSAATMPMGELLLRAELLAQHVLQLFTLHLSTPTPVKTGVLRQSLELGLFVGFKYSGDARQQKKRLLILDKEPYRYQRFLSDIAGQDIRSH